MIGPGRIDLAPGGPAGAVGICAEPLACKNTRNPFDDVTF
jgi:hypothetical protein